MKKYVFLIAVVFIYTNAYAIDMPWFARQKDKAKEAVVVKNKPAVPVKMVVAKPVIPAKVVVATPVPPVKVVVVNPVPLVNVVAAVPPAASAAPAPQKKLTKEEMIARINEMLKNHPNIVSAIQGLEVKQEGGAAVCIYNGKRLEELDEEALFRILTMINQQISIENQQKFDRQQRQLKNLQQIEQINRTQRALREQQALTKSAAPKIYAPPKIPRTRY